MGRLLSCLYTRPEKKNRIIFRVMRIRITYVHDFISNVCVRHRRVGYLRTFGRKPHIDSTRLSPVTESHYTEL